MARGIDYREIGLTVGLEIHQQLDTRSKLFCPCPAELTDEGHDEFERRLRPTRGESGEVDVAALFEWRKGVAYEYQAPPGHSCLVEADEEPPHGINRDAVVIAMAIAKALNSWIVDEIHVMRKIVIDGSNTTGFQRTAIVALGGYIEVGGARYSIETIAVEEDAARKVGEKPGRITFKLDRLGIPLIEVSTGPDIHDPREAYEVALALGRLFRLTGRVKRGLGTIRQDLNISIKGGAKTEVKGVQRLDLIPKVIEYEVQRQLRLLELKGELERRGLREDDLKGLRPVDVTHVFQSTGSRVIRRALESGGRVYAVALPGFHGLLGWELMPGRRFGTELADYARFWADVGGIFHTDELPAYGITQAEVDKLYEALGARKGVDAIVIVADDPAKAVRALEVVIGRARMAFRGVPEETRAALEDGTTKFLRPRPGSARMYPETDVPPLPVSEDMHREAEAIKPEPVDVKLRRLEVEYGLGRDLAEQVIRDIRLDLIERLIRKYGNRLPPKVIASIFVVTLRGLRGEGVDVDSISDEALEDLVSLIAEGAVAKEAAEEILKLLAKEPGLTARQAAEKLGLTRIPVEEAERIVEKIIMENMDAVRARGEGAYGLLMGKAMAVLRGRVDGKVVADIVRRKLQEALSRAQ